MPLILPVHFIVCLHNFIMVDSQIVTHNLPDAVVWNAWIAKAASMADMEPDGWKRYVCVEPAVIMSPVHLQAGQTFDAYISLAVVARK
jgi:glucose-6-phosphate 1-epimerase